ncbi:MULTISPECIES: APC family permease [unclassified Arsukibacterium]|uniref:APC family permease n=1 Tax=unclassified Arsukibacterium TaxID=2635278 RepID=UPI000C56C54F|nr:MULTISPECIES: APC family permease [unclassified Arsukibacterium]MBM32875.1 cationic amino acid transporter [Rheinheimera sp.]|tara:strand:- start:55710 stop:57026 length:1317 start_codon:yes stop_codon:yes gene_type:complete
MPDLKTAVTGNTLPRHLGLFGLWLLVVNGLIGAGIFGLPGGAAKLAGEYSPLIYLFCALLILPILLCMAELASYFRGSGGPVRYGTAAFGPFIGFQAGWLYYIARLVSFAANSVLLVDSIGYFWPAAIAGFNRVMLLAAIIVSLTLINVVGSLRAMRSLALLTVIKFAVLLLLVVAGASLLGTKLLPDFNPLTVFNSPYDIGAATLLLIYAFVGFESVVVPAGEAKNPARDMPRALILGLLLVTLLYIGIQLVSVAAVTDIANSSSPLLDVAAALFGPAGAMVLMLGVVASVAANLLGAIFSTPRASFALAEDGSLPRWFGAVQPHFLTPANSIMFFGVLALMLALYGSFLWLAAATVVSRLLLYGLTCAAVPVLRPKLAVSNSFVLPLGYTIPLLGLAACGWLALQVSLSSVIATALFVLLGTALYFLARWQAGPGN